MIIPSSFTPPSLIIEDSLITSASVNSRVTTLSNWISSFVRSAPQISPTGNVTLTANNYVVYGVPTSNSIYTLPSITSTSVTFVISKDNNNKSTITINAAAGNTIKGLSSYILYTQYSSVILQSVQGSTEWKIVNEVINSNRLYAAVGATIAGNMSNSTVIVPFNQEDADPNSDFDNINYRYTTPLPGLYSVSGAVGIFRSSAVDIGINLRVNGAISKALLYEPPRSGDFVFPINWAGFLNAGQNIDIVASSNGTANTRSGTLLTYATFQFLKP